MGQRIWPACAQCGATEYTCLLSVERGKHEAKVCGRCYVLPEERLALERKIDAEATTTTGEKTDG